MRVFITVIRNGKGILLMAITETKTKYGQIHGTPKEGYTVFRGVPYAKPPVGEKRFCPPEEPAWLGGRL